MKNDAVECENSIRVAQKAQGGEFADLRGVFAKICADNGVAAELVEAAWRDFVKIRQNFSLAGGDLGWLAVALFSHWRGKPEHTREISRENPDYKNPAKFDLLKILRATRFETVDFLSKCHRWARMCKMDSGHAYSVEKLLFNQTNVSRLFSRYLENFSHIFILPLTFSPIDFTYNRRKQRKKPVCNNELFHFIWILFIAAKTFLTALNSDYKDLIHLLNCCLQEIFGAILLSSHKEKFINKQFSVLNSDFLAKNITFSQIPLISAAIYPNEPPAFHQHFKDIQYNHWKKFLAEMISKGNLRLNFDSPAEIIEPDTFSFNLHMLEKFFIDQMAQNDFLDERQFLFCLYDTDFNPFHSLQLQIVIDSCKKPLNVSPTSSVTSPAKSLTLSHKIDTIRSLVKVFLNYSEFHSEIQRIDKSGRIFKLSTIITDEMFQKLIGLPMVDQLVTDFEIIRGIYYKFLISVLNSDRFKNCCNSNKESVEESNSQEISQGFDKDKNFNDCKNLQPIFSPNFHHNILAFAIEIYAFLSKLQDYQFPWIVNGIDIKIIEFFKIIELIVLADRGLARNVIKHLNMIEESIIGYYAWTTKGDLLKIIDKYGDVPSFNDTKLPCITDKNISDIHFKVDLLAGRKNNLAVVTFNPENTDVDKSNRRERLMSATRNLFNENGEKIEEKEESRPESPKDHKEPKEDKEVKIPEPEIILPDNPYSSSGDNDRDSSTRSSYSDSQKPNNQSLTPLIFFMRKFYHLASQRLMNLCDFLKMNLELKSRCWTCLEYVITKYHRLFENHYLDQLIMCCVYAVGRSSGLNWSFNEILRWYRSQDYCVGDAFRRVLMAPIYRNDGSLVECSENEYGDLITYYNKVFLTPINKYLLKLFDKSEPNTIELSPLPIIKSLDSFKPQKLASNCKIFVSPKKIDMVKHEEFVKIIKLSGSPFRVRFDLNLGESYCRKRSFNDFSIKKKFYDRFSRLE